MFVSPRMTNEELYLTQKLARIGLGTHNVTTFANLVNRELLCPEVMSTATLGDVQDAQAIVVVNSLLDEEHFTVDLIAHQAIRKGGKLVHIAPKATRTSQFSEVFLQCKPGTEVEVLHAMVQAAVEAGKLSLEAHPALKAAIDSAPFAARCAKAGVEASAVREAAELVSRSLLKVVVFNKDYRGMRVPGDERAIVAAADAVGAPYLALREKSNMQGLISARMF